MVKMIFLLFSTLASSALSRTPISARDILSRAVRLSIGEGGGVQISESERRGLIAVAADDGMGFALKSNQASSTSAIAAFDARRPSSSKEERRELEKNDDDVCGAKQGVTRSQHSSSTRYSFTQEAPIRCRLQGLSIFFFQQYVPAAGRHLRSAAVSTYRHRRRLWYVPGTGGLYLSFTGMLAPIIAFAVTVYSIIAPGLLGALFGDALALLARVLRVYASWLVVRYNPFFGFPNHSDTLWFVRRAFLGFALEGTALVTRVLLIGGSSPTCLYWIFRAKHSPTFGWLVPEWLGKQGGPFSGSSFRGMGGVSKKLRESGVGGKIRGRMGKFKFGRRRRRGRGGKGKRRGRKGRGRGRRGGMGRGRKSQRKGRLGNRKMSGGNRRKQRRGKGGRRGGMNSKQQRRRRKQEQAKKVKGGPKRENRLKEKRQARKDQKKARKAEARAKKEAKQQASMMETQQVVEEEPVKIDAEEENRKAEIQAKRQARKDQKKARKAEARAKKEAKQQAAMEAAEASAADEVLVPEEVPGPEKVAVPEVEAPEEVPVPAEEVAVLEVEAPEKEVEEERQPRERRQRKARGRKRSMSLKDQIREEQIEQDVQGALGRTFADPNDAELSRMGLEAQYLQVNGYEWVIWMETFSTTCYYTGLVMQIWTFFGLWHYCLSYAWNKLKVPLAPFIQLWLLQIELVKLLWVFVPIWNTFAHYLALGIKGIINKVIKPITSFLSGTVSSIFKFWEWR